MLARGLFRPSVLRTRATAARALQLTAAGRDAVGTGDLYAWTAAYETLGASMPASAVIAALVAFGAKNPTVHEPTLARALVQLADHQLVAVPAFGEALDAPGDRGNALGRLDSLARALGRLRARRVCAVPVRLAERLAARATARIARAAPPLSPHALSVHAAAMVAMGAPLPSGWLALCFGAVRDASAPLRVRPTYRLDANANALALLASALTTALATRIAAGGYASAPAEHAAFAGPLAAIHAALAASLHAVHARFLLDAVRAMADLPPALVSAPLLRQAAVQVVLTPGKFARELDAPEALLAAIAAASRLTARTQAVGAPLAAAHAALAYVRAAPQTDE